ncbi:hypothetical protein [Fundidesulfovibrio soli]|uniref:hypothetical protein n=1 Tax=Fundidesulfovibrio soli TaxID=2922716 RepID=UPI001FB02EB8|nr:hypothetical protein [Fundidesulfovibrio soli]
MVWRVVLGLVCLGLVASPSAMASDADELVLFRKYYVDFVKRTTQDMEPMLQAFYDAGRAIINSKHNTADLEAYAKMSIDVWQLRALVEIAQDTLLASVVETGIVIDTQAKPVVYVDSINRFPAPVLSLTRNITAAFAANKNEILSAAWVKMQPQVTDLAEAFKDWPGPYLKKQMQQGKPGKGDLPEEVVKLAAQVDKLVDVTLEYSGRIMDLRGEVAKDNSEYCIVLGQYVRNLTTLSAAATDAFMLVTTRQRLEMTKAKAEVTKDDHEIVDHYLEWRLKRYQEVLSLLEKQCNLLVEEQKTQCVSILSGFRYLHKKFEGIALSPEVNNK